MRLFVMSHHDSYNSNKITWTVSLSRLTCAICVSLKSYCSYCLRVTLSIHSCINIMEFMRTHLLFEAYASVWWYSYHRWNTIKVSFFGCLFRQWSRRPLNTLAPNCFKMPAARVLDSKPFTRKIILDTIRKQTILSFISLCIHERFCL